MKRYLIFIFFISKICLAQNWATEVMVGTSAYNGDLTQQLLSVKRLNPAIGFNIKYNSGNFFDFRAGLSFERISGNDKDNKSAFLQARNLSFKSNILEFNLSIEFNLADPLVYNQYPYLFAGLGVFHFNPYTYDDNNKKTYLQPLSTEGEGLPDYPNRKKYSLIQPCVPIGIGFKWKPKEDSRLQWSYEFGYRVTFTDYLDDVSKTYVSIETLGLKKGSESAALSYRKIGVPFSEEGYPRGNSKVKDYYFFTGFRLALKLQK